MADYGTDPTESWRDFARSAGVSPADVLAAGARAVALRCAAGARIDDESAPAPTFRALLADRRPTEPPVGPRADGHLTTLLHGAVAAPDVPISALPLLTAAEEAELDGWNATAVDHGDQPMTPELVDRRCAQQPDEVAVAAGDGPLTGRQLADRVARLAGYLADRGIRPGDRVGVCLERSAELIVALLAVWRVGAAYVPLEPGYPAARLALMAEDARLALVLSRSGLADRLPSAVLPMAWLDRDSPRVAAAAPITAVSPVSGGTPAYVIYTSGSTGRPKGVVNTHAGLRNRLLWMQEEYRLGPTDAVLQKTPCGFDVSVWELFWPLLAGARLVMARPDGHRDPGYLAATIESERITVLHFVPSMLRVFLRAADLSRCGSLRQVVCSGEVLPAALIGQFYEKLAPIAPAVRLDNLYGPTEAAIDVTRWACGPADAAADPVPIGTPIANTSTHVVDRNGNRMPVGCTGELLLGGVQVAAGYLERPELTAERFIPDRFSPAPDARLYRTGDLVRRRPDGVLEYLGRIDDQVKLRGQRIELGEIEAQLRATPGVTDAAVLLHASPDAPGDERLVAYVVLAATEAGAEVGAGAVAAVTAGLAERLPDAFVPAEFVTLPELPLSPNGKTDRAALAALRADRPNPPAAGGGRLPAGAIPRQVAKLWADALGMAEPAPNAGFVQLGGHSLRAALLVAGIRAELGVEVTVGAVLEAPTLTRFVTDHVVPALAGAADRPDGPVARHQTSSPLSFAQHRLWFLHRMHPELTAYHLHVAWELTGELDAGALRTALEVVLRRHQVLRSGIEVDPAGEPVLVVRPADAVELPITDVASPSGLAAHLRASFDRPFDLARGPLLRAEVFGLGPGKQVLLLVVHHLAADEWTLGLLGAELSAAYSALTAGHPVELPDLPLQYGDYAHWQHASLTNGALAEHREYWTRQLAGLEPVTLLPDRPRPPRQSFAGRRAGIWVPPEVLATLRAAARPQGGTDFMALIAGLHALLSRWTGRQDVAVGTVTADRRTTDLHGLAGFFVNTVVLRVDLSGDPSFEQLVRRVRDATTDAIKHQDLPFDQMMAAAGGPRDGSGAPLFGVAVSYLNTPPGEIGFRGLSAQEVGLDTGVVRFDLDVFMRERDGGIAVEVDYRIDLFDEVSIRRLLAGYLRLLTEAGRNPAAPIAEADLTGPDGRTEPAALGRRPVPHPAAPLVPDLVAEQARLRPDATAVRSTERVLSYAELDSEADRLAGRLRTLGAGRDRIVAVLLERSADFVVALLAVLKAGAGYLPLDPSLPDERLAELIADSGAPFVVSRTALAGRLGGTAATVVPVDAPAPDAAGHDPAAGSRPVGPTDLAYVIYTSGSTGRPKGVLVEHAALANLCHWHVRAYGLTPADRGTLVAAQAFDASVWELWPYLVAGASVGIADEAIRSDPDRIVRWLAEQRATVAFLATPLAEAVLDSDQVRGLPLRLLLTGGDRLRRRPAPGLAFPVINHYGPTECTVVATAGTVADTEHGRGAPAIGRPIDNVEAHVLDDRRQPVPRGAVGELYLGGVQVARGYLGRPELTARHFLDSPFGRLYRTGDLARWRNDGELEFLGRADRQIKIRGYRIEPGEVEVRLRTHPGVTDTVVMAQPADPRRPDGDRRLVAYLTAPPGPAPAPAELRRWLREHLPEHLVPTRFVLVDQWPMTPSGKIDQARLPPPADAAEDTAYVAPRDDVEREIAQLVATLLGRERVGIRDGFFELGGDSLLAARLTAQLYRAFGVELPVGAVFTGSTVEEIATALVTAALAEESGQAAGNGGVQR